MWKHGGHHGKQIMGRKKIDRSEKITLTQNELKQIQNERYLAGYEDGKRAIREDFIDLLGLDKRYEG